MEKTHIKFILCFGRNIYFSVGVGVALYNVYRYILYIPVFCIGGYGRYVARGVSNRPEVRHRGRGPAAGLRFHQETFVEVGFKRFRFLPGLFGSFQMRIQ